MSMRMLAIVPMLTWLLAPPIASAQGEKQQEVSSLDNFQSVLNVFIDIYTDGRRQHTHIDWPQSNNLAASPHC